MASKYDVKHLASTFQQFFVFFHSAVDKKAELCTLRSPGTLRGIVGTKRKHVCIDEFARTDALRLRLHKDFKRIVLVLENCSGACVVKKCTDECVTPDLINCAIRNSFDMFVSDSLLNQWKGNKQQTVGSFVAGPISFDLCIKKWRATTGISQGNVNFILRSWLHDSVGSHIKIHRQPRSVIRLISASCAGSPEGWKHLLLCHEEFIGTTCKFLNEMEQLINRLSQPLDYKFWGAVCVDPLQRSLRQNRASFVIAVGCSQSLSNMIALMESKALILDGRQLSIWDLSTALYQKRTKRFEILIVKNADRIVTSDFAKLLEKVKIMQRLRFVCLHGAHSNQNVHNHPFRALANVALHFNQQFNQASCHTIRGASILFVNATTRTSPNTLDPVSELYQTVFKRQTDIFSYVE